jgi:hypothetical protein
MRSAPRLAAALLAALGFTGSWEGAGYAHDKGTCVAASDQGQGLRLDGKLTAARVELLVCADPSCPSIVRAACARWLIDLERQIPSIIVVARDSAGTDVLGVHVSLDGGEPHDVASGRPTPLDPGTHTLHFVAPSGAVVDRVLVLAEGEQRRLVEAVFPTAPAAILTAPASMALTLPPVLATHPRPGVGWPTWAFTIGAAVAWTAFGVSALDGHLEFESAASSCKGSCSPDRYSSINTKFLVADVSLGAAVVASGIALVLLLTRPSHPDAPPSGTVGTALSF